MNRREFSALAGSALGLLAGGANAGAGPVAALQGKLPPLKITDVRTFLTAPADIRLLVVKVETNEPGLYGLGCATFTQRVRVVETAVDKYLNLRTGNISKRN